MAAGLGCLPMLTKLQLRNNQLRNLNGLEQLEGLRELGIENNNIRCERVILLARFTGSP